ncbi:hypothetical protein TNCV_1735921 [Trichonephila clavipes]|nr:hypothetical protein TNCV_1735921 [Trichonephila clavipes]
MLIYKFILRPFLTYATPIWAHAARSHINQIEASQSIILLQILNARWFMRNPDLGTGRGSRSKVHHGKILGGPTGVFGAKKRQIEGFQKGVNDEKLLGSVCIEVTRSVKKCSVIKLHQLIHYGALKISEETIAVYGNDRLSYDSVVDREVLRLLEALDPYTNVAPTYDP